jgi:hypothetical protein
MIAIANNIARLAEHEANRNRLKAAFANQDAAASDVVMHYRNGFHYVLLQADLQSGKTGTYHTVARLMLEAGLVDRVVVLCGETSTDLRDQFKADVLEWHGNDGRVQSFFRQDLRRAFLPASRVLIVVDESHITSKTGMKVPQFLQRHGLDMAGTSDHMRENQIYMLSVSATPYAELSDMLRKKCLPKAHVKLENGVGYVGPRQYWETGRVHSTWSLDTMEGQERFNDLLLSYSSENKYAMIRAPARARDAEILRDLIRWLKIPIIEFTTDYERAHGGCPAFAVNRERQTAVWMKHGQLVPCLEDAPSEFTVVFVDGRLRCGKRICKRHIGFVWEASRTSNTDTAMQSLWGRVCGYDVVLEDAPHIYLPPCLLNRQDEKKKVWSSEVERALGWGVVAMEDGDGEGVIEDAEILPRKASNLVPGRVQNRAMRDRAHEVYPCVPIRLRMRPGTVEYDHLLAVRGNRLATKAHCLGVLMDHAEELLGVRNHMLTPEQRTEILHRLEGLEVAEREDGVHVRKFEEGSESQNHHRALVRGYETCSAPSEHVAEFPFLTFCVTYPGFNPHPSVEATVGEVFAMIYTESEGLFDSIDIDSRVSEAKSNTYFRPTVALPDALVNVPAVCMFGFSPAIYRDPALFERQMCVAIQALREAEAAGMLISRRFEGLLNGESLRFHRETYVDVWRGIIARVEADMAVTLKVSRVPVWNPTDFVLQWIEWAEA